MTRTRRVKAGFTFQPATADRWPDLEALFGERGACGGCWCMAWRLPRAGYEAGKSGANRKALRRLTREVERRPLVTLAVAVGVGALAVGLLARRD